jgi:hypothetical protein
LERCKKENVLETLNPEKSHDNRRVTAQSRRTPTPRNRIAVEQNLGPRRSSHARSRRLQVSFAIRTLASESRTFAWHNNVAMNRGVERPSLNDGGAADGLNENFSQKNYLLK